MELQVSEFLQNNRTWSEEARIFLPSVYVGESFKLEGARVIKKMCQLLSDEYQGEFASRILEDGRRVFIRIKNKTV